MLEKIVEIIENYGIALCCVTEFYCAGADETDKFLDQLAALKQKFTVPMFWIMLEKEFKDDSKTQRYC